MAVRSAMLIAFPLCLAVAPMFADIGGQSFVGNDLEPPSVVVSKPLRGEYLISPDFTVEGTATDAGSGVVSLIVNGTPVTPDPVTGAFALPIALTRGINLISVRAADRAGNTSVTTVGVMYSETYFAADARVRDAAVARASEDVLAAMAGTLAPSLERRLDGKLAQARLFHDKVSVLGLCVASADVRVTSVTFDPVQIALDAVPGGVNALVQVPNFRLQANARSYCGIPYAVTGEVGAQTAVVDVGLTLAIDPEGGYRTEVTRSAVAVNGFRFDIYGIPSIIERAVRSGVERELQARLADVIEAQLPRLVRRSLESLSSPIQRTWDGMTVTLTLKPTSLVFDDLGFAAAFDGNVIGEKNPATPAVPGAVFLRASPQVVPRFENTAGFYVSLNENLFNQALFASWQSGFWNLEIDRAFLQSAGIGLPFALDSSLIAAFFPQLAGMLTPNTIVPLRLDLAPQCLV